jgi:hypothetical protein
MKDNMKTHELKIPVHSVTDLITNSSTTIFTYSGSSEQVLKDMINEIFKTFGIYNKCEDVFDTVVLCNDKYQYTEYIDDCDGEYPEGVDETTDINQLYDDVKSGKLPKPAWFHIVEESESSYDYFTPSTYLYIIPKEKEYEKLSELIKSFLYSTSHEATRDG